jgi:TorA maturation chaperone TorD
VAGSYGAADACAGRATVYQVLALGFGEPTAGLVEALASGELAGAVRAAVAWLGPAAASFEPALAGLAGERRGASDAECERATPFDGAGALRELAVDHARLFTGPGRPAVRCYASQYLDVERGRPARLNTAAAAWAAAAYTEAGVALAGGRHELPDHAVIELEFLYHLCRREEHARDAGDADEADRLHGLSDRFLGEHAGLWLPDFATSVRAVAEGGLYATLADLLTAQLTVEGARSGYDPLRWAAAGEGRDRSWTG